MGDEGSGLSGWMWLVGCARRPSGVVVVGVKLSRRLIGRMSVVLKLVGVAPCRDLLEGSGGLFSRPCLTAAVIKGTIFSTIDVMSLEKSSIGGG